MECARPVLRAQGRRTQLRSLALETETKKVPSRGYFSLSRQRGRRTKREESLRAVPCTGNRQRRHNCPHLWETGPRFPVMGRLFGGETVGSGQV